MTGLALVFGAVVGLSLGLTGGGGAIFAVPLLVFGMAVPAREAVGVSLAAVGTTAFVGFLHRLRLCEVELRTGMLFAVAGMLGAPLGAQLSEFIPDALLMSLFAGLMGIVAARLWRQAGASARGVRDYETTDQASGPTCERDEAGALVLTSRCAVLLVLVGVATGLLSGLFGVGGGFVIVPALVLFSGMSIHRAVGTSLMVITLVSAAGLATHVWSERDVPVAVTALFVVGGVAGMFAGQSLGRRLSALRLQ
ncbi:MAG: sulfite exporter TauE/SafE family protein, partial [Planctomycetia bacterium]|nr:sulfite exporter TauE/SafE family protein [Planctomycetia bacterium]